LTLRLFDASGKLVRQSSISFNSQRVDISTLPRTPLILELSHPDGRRHVQKIIRQ
jgi:hypothetical protein